MRTPVSTYRLQIRPGFTLQDAAATVPYLKSLGVDWVYLSPILTAEQGSDHGYDVTDPSAIDPDRGGPDGLQALSAAARDAGLGVLVDIVPNHVGVATPAQNPWWWSLLKEGQQSRYAPAFDVDWDFGGGRIRIPVLGSDDDLDALEVVDGELRYYDHRFPLAEGSYTDGDDPRQVHDRQHYELVFWRRADDELNYRRFFAVNTLAGIRVEDPEVFDEAHAEVVRWFREGLVDGLRIDHPDGLADPEGYLRRLREVTNGSYLLIEKILEPGEVLPAGFDCEGTTGYDALADVDRVFVDAAGQDALDALDAALRGGAAADYEDMIHGTKRRITDGILHSEMLRLARLVPAGQGPTGETAADALSEIIAAFPVYRTYLPEGQGILKEACELAARRRPELADAIEQLLPLLLDASEELGRRFQQTSGMVMAKGVEDTAFFRYTRLGTLTEVGADPTEFAVSPDGVPPADEPPPRGASVVHDDPQHPRHEAQRGHPGPDLRARRARARMDGVAAPAPGTGPAARRPAGEPAVAGHCGSVARQPRTSAVLCPESLPRSREFDRLAGPGRGLRSKTQCSRRRGIRQHGRSAPNWNHLWHCWPLTAP